MGLHGPWGIKLPLIAVLAGLVNYVKYYDTAMLFVSK